MGRMNKLIVQNYRSIKDPVEITFSDGLPLILVGENNSGKSNLVRAIDLVLGESWPNTYQLEDHEFYNRDKSNTPVKIEVYVKDITHTTSSGYQYNVSCFIWEFPRDNDHFFYCMTDRGEEYNYLSKETREQCISVVVGADRRLSYQLSYTSKYTFLSKLMRKFNQALTADAECVDELKIKFEETKEIFQRIPSFSTFAEELKTQVEELSGNLEYSLSIDFSAYDPSNYFHALRVHPFRGNEALSFEELGTGQEQILALSFATAYAKAFHEEAGGLVLIIEEPEVHLHPLAQKWVSQKIYELARQGVQVIVTTHSPTFLSLLGLENLALVRKKNSKATEVVQISAELLAAYCRKHGALKAAKENILLFYSAAATEEILAGFFARRIILVEGPTESMALPAYLDKIGFNTTKNGVAIIPVHGVGNLAKWWRLFTAYSIPVYVIFDNDANDDNAGSKRKDLLRTLSISEEKIEDFISTKSIIVENNLTIFGNNFEHSLRATFGEAYLQLEREALDKFGLSKEQSKPLIARHVAQHLEFDENHAGWIYFKTLSEKIKALI